MRTALLVLFALGCSPPPPPAPPPAAPPVEAPPPPPPPVEVAPPLPPPPPDPCQPLAKGQVSRDDTPSIAGTTARATPRDWLDARGISQDAFRAWIRAHDRDLEDEDADNLYEEETACGTLKVGDKSEDALACPLKSRTLVIRESAIVFVVRDKHIVPVLEVGYAMPELADPHRWFDLQLTFAPGGLEADLHDRAKPGTKLVVPVSGCHEAYAEFLKCDKAQRDGTSTNACWLPDGSPHPEAGTELFGCAAGLPKLAAFIQRSMVDPSGTYSKAELRDNRAFAVKTCAARGHYKWNAGRFVRG